MPKGYRKSDGLPIWLGKEFSEEHKKKIGLKSKGRLFYYTKEYKEKLRKKQMGKNNSFYAKQHSEEFKNKLRQLYKGRTLEKHPRWKGGRWITKEGYIRINLGKYGRKRIFEHRLIMEKHLGRLLESYEKIHHKNGIKNDNRIENLEIVCLKKHYGEIICPYCQKKFLIR